MAGAWTLYLALVGISLSLKRLFVWNQPIPKPNKKAYLAFALLAILSLIGLWVLPYG